MKTLLYIIAIPILSTIFSFAQSNSNPPCSAPEAGQFDFWVSEWDLTWTDKKGIIQTGTNNISKILNGCVIEENFSGGNFIGKSVSVYNHIKKLWQQTWVDNSGGYLEFTGGMQDDQMILSRDFKNKEGKTIKQRMVFYNISANELDWNWEKSTDGGKTWQLAWKIHYKRKP